MLKQLPPEIILLILVDISYPLLYKAKSTTNEKGEAKRTLASCSLVSHSWKAMAQPKLFYIFAVTFIKDGHYDDAFWEEESIPRTIGDLFASLDSHGRLVAYTQTFRLIGDFMNAAHLKLSQLLRILSYFPRLKSLVLDSVDVAISPSDGLGAPSTLETLVFDNTEPGIPIDVGHLWPLLAPFSGVRELDINIILLPTTTQKAEDILLPHFRHLSSLALACYPTTGILVDIFKASAFRNMPSLQHLLISGIRPEYVAHPQRLCTSLGSRLTSATLEFDLANHILNYYPDFHLGSCTKLQTLNLTMIAFHVPSQSTSPHVHNMWKFIVRFFKNIRDQSALPSLQKIVFIYAETFSFDPDKANINLDPTWTEIETLERIFLGLPRLEYVGFKPRPNSAGYYRFSEQDRVVFDKCFPTMAQRGMLGYPTSTRLDMTS